MIMATVALCSSSLATDEKTIEVKDAAHYVGQTVVVHGTVVDVHQFKGGSIVLDFGAKYPNEVFVVYIPVNVVQTTGDMQITLGKRWWFKARLKCTRASRKSSLRMRVS